jgi:protein-disulfide isomerase
MGKRQEMRASRQRERTRNRILMIGMVAVGALLIGFAFMAPMMNIFKGTGNTTPDASAITPVTPKVFNTRVDGQHLGDPNAPVKVDVWEDFQCPSCMRYSQQVESQVITNYIETGKVYYSYHFYPLIDGGNLTGESHQSANAAMCASEQGRFWDYHAILFANWSGENQGSFSNLRLVAFAENLGLDMNAFNTCFQANRYADFINQDYIDGQAAGVQGTPSVFVDGQIVTPGYIPTYDQLAAAIETALAGK